MLRLARIRYSHTHIRQMKKREATNFVRCLLSKQVVLHVCCAGGIRVDRNVETPD